MRQGTDNQNIQEAQKTKLPPKSMNQQRGGNCTKQSFFKGSLNGQKTHEKMHTIPCHKRNENQSHTKIPPHSC
jgi:hypothetical protein